MQECSFSEARGQVFDLVAEGGWEGIHDEKFIL